jgi:large subunit ribosomal protein L31
MKKDIHPDYQDILFVDSATGHKFVCGANLKPKEKEKFEGKEYPVYYLSVSSASHPFFTGSKQFIDTEGRVDKFLKRYAPKAAAAPQEEKENEKEKSAAASKKKKK